MTVYQLAAPMLHCSRATTVKIRKAEPTKVNIVSSVEPNRFARTQATGPTTVMGGLRRAGSSK